MIMIRERSADGSVPSGQIGVGIIVLNVINKIGIAGPHDEKVVRGVGRGRKVIDIVPQTGAVLTEIGPVFAGVIRQPLPLCQHFNPDPAVGKTLAMIERPTIVIIGRGANAVPESVEGIEGRRG